MSNNSRYGFIPYIFVLFFIVLSLIYGTWLYIASTTYSGSVSYVENGKGLYKKYPVKNKISYLPFPYSLEVKKVPQGWKFLLMFDRLIDDSEQVVLNLMSPVTNKYDQHIVMSKKGMGIYKALLDCKEGQWDIEILVELKDQAYIITRRIFLHDKKFINASVKQH